jgi:hypothetical protein
VGELVDLGLAVLDLAAQALQLLVFVGNGLTVLLALVRDLCNQIAGQFPQLFCVQTGQ